MRCQIDTNKSFIFIYLSRFISFCSSFAFTKPAPDDSTHPQFMTVDYVRVYQKVKEQTP